MQHTTNYDLPQWEATDAVRREDVNGAMSSIDSAIEAAAATGGGNCYIRNFIYTGYGAYGVNDPMTLFTPGYRPLFVSVQREEPSSSGDWGLFATWGTTWACTNRRTFDTVTLDWKDGALYFYGTTSAQAQLNELNVNYRVVMLVKKES